MDRVSDLLRTWARALGRDEDEIVRWSAAGRLHDVLRDADPADLLRFVTAAERDFPPKALHGPAAAARLTGLVAPSVVNAIRYHTLGHPGLDLLGRALYLADFLEPGRHFADDERALLRGRVPVEIDQVLIEVVAWRIRNLLELRSPIHPHTTAFWGNLVSGERS
jgi:2-amino-4-hydroxy-6-hydroxymethyldihydropteridine diphosphokinase